MAEKFVDGRSNDNDKNWLRRIIVTWSDSSSRPVARTSVRRRAAPCSRKGILPARIVVERLDVGVEDPNPEASVGRDKAERESDVSTPPQVRRSPRSVTGSCSSYTRLAPL